MRYSLTGSFLFAAVFTLGNYFRLKPENRTLENIASMYVWWFILLMVLLLVAFFIGGGIYNRRRKMEQELEEEELEDEDE